MIVSEDAAQAFCRAHVSPDGYSRLEQLTDMLRQENQEQNLVAEASLASVWTRHIADSLQLVSHVPRETGDWLDLGSGAGFPGLVVAIACPDTPCLLVESRKLRVDWLRRAAEALNLANVEVLLKRVEALEPFKAGVISARAFAPLGKLLGLAARFSTSDTYWALPKGRSARHELEGQSAHVQRMFHVEQSLTDPQAGVLIGRGVPQPR
jgi:16S rRNA (guanine527-N7)-methyltransferase